MRHYGKGKVALARRLEQLEPAHHPRNPKWKVNLPPDILLVGYLKPDHGPEITLQNKSAKYLREVNLLFNHSPNEGKRGKGKQQTQSGMSKGFPDLFIYEPNEKYNGLAVELKIRGGAPSKEQMDWLVKLAGRGYKSVLCYSFETFVKTILKYQKSIMQF